jgi:exodeoxyribonuclease V gamma subunit
VARLYRTIFASIGRQNDVRIYTLNPCREFWEDLEPQRRSGRDARRFPRRRARAQLTLAFGAAPPEPEAPAPAPAVGDDENPLLARWGRPGRDNLRLLNQLTDCDSSSCFADPTEARPSLLATLQREVLERRPPAADRPGADDGSLIVLPAPDPRRELETIAAEIWTLVRRDEERERRGEPGAPLRFSDFAVVVPPASAPSTLALARAVFQEASDLPATIVDLPSTGEARVLEAVELLLALMTSPLRRPDLLRLAMHPVIARRFPDVDPEDWLALADELQIVRGADRHDTHLEDSYLDGDRISWDQGLRRLALGAFLSGQPSGEERPFALGGELYLPAEVTGGGEAAARALGLLARSLIDLAQAARQAPRPIGDWLALARRAIAETIVPTTPDEESAVGDCLAALERLSETLPPGLSTGFLVAADLLRERLGRSGAETHRPPEGVTVASFVPMRAIPFRVVFVAGLEESAFPSAATLDALDLRAGNPREGDVTPRQRDEYMFLETLLAARERLYLSYVARDALTGEEQEPSSVIRVLCETLGPELAAAVTRPRPPLARHADPDARAVIPAAAREHQAEALGASLRRAAGAVELPPIAALRRALAPEAWAALAPRLGWLEASAPLSSPTPPAAVRQRALTLTDLRRFLECPLQGSVRVLLPLRREDDAADDAEASLRDYEPLEASGLEASAFLREVLVTALADDDAARDRLAHHYDALAEPRRQIGVLPSGFFGRAARARHLDLLACWRDGLATALRDTLPRGLAPIWLGGGPEHRPGLAIHPALPLPISLAGTPATIELAGRTELLGTVGDHRYSVSLLASRRYDSAHRDLLRPWLTQLALSAAGLSDGPLGAIVIRPNGGREPQLDEWLIPPIARAEARDHLAALASELVRDVHPYLLPCEGVFTWRRRQEKGEPMTVRQAVLMLRDDGWTYLSSDRGPVPDARSYPVPPDGDGEAIVARRFGRFFELAPPLSNNKKARA